MSLRLTRQGMRLDTLRTLSNQLHEDAMEDEKAIDFSSVGLYLAGLQAVFAIVCCASASVLCCWLMPPSAISAVRTLAITTVVGLLLVRKPLRVGPTRGVVTVFNALRPSIAIYILALTIEQLVHTCVLPDDDVEQQRSVVRRGIYHTMTAILALSGFVRARNPRSESDLPFMVAAICVLVIALLPPPAIAKAGPLCEPAQLMSAGERVLRALLFASVYVSLVYTAAPNSNQSNELFICVARATAASTWVLGISAWGLPLAPVQVALALFTRLHENNASMAGGSHYHNNGHYNGHHHHHVIVDTDMPIGMVSSSSIGGAAYGMTEHTPLTSLGAQTPIDAGSDVECGDIGGGGGVGGMCTLSDPESVKLALAASARPLLSNGGSPSTAGMATSTHLFSFGSGGGNGGGSGGTNSANVRMCMHSANIAAIVARETAGSV